MAKILFDVYDASCLHLSSPLMPDDVVLDIGGNDGTLLSNIKHPGVKLINIDAAENISQLLSGPNYFYCNSLFTADAYRHIETKSPKLIFSIAMFYHLHDPLVFTKDVAAIMDESSIWCIQMSYAGSMIKNCVVDNIVHEHIAYYTFSSLQFLLRSCGLVMFDAEIVDVYGGSMRVFVKKYNPSQSEQPFSPRLQALLEQEAILGFNEYSALISFNHQADCARRTLSGFIHYLQSRNERIYGLGASTKGNMLLQYAGLSNDDILGVFDNSDKKIGTTMLGSGIPVLDEHDLQEIQPTALLILPYYFYNGLKDLFQRICSPRQSGTTLIKPLPFFTVESI